MAICRTFPSGLSGYISKAFRSLKILPHKYLTQVHKKQLLTSSPVSGTFPRCGIHTNTIEAVQAIEKVKARVGSMDLVLTGHDPAAMQKYPRAAEGVYLIEGGLP